MSLFQASMKLCDDCNRKCDDMSWWGRHIRICNECRRQRLALGAAPASPAIGPAQAPDDQSKPTDQAS